MIDVVHKMCIGCNQVQSRFNFPDFTSGTHCNSCKEPGMINVVNKMCIKCNQVQATFNFPGSKKRTHCSSCKEPGMISLASRMCIKCNQVQSTFNFPDSTTPTHCGACKESGMIDVGNKKCVVCSQVQPRFNFPGFTTGTHCSACKEPTMINVVDRKCESCKVLRPLYALQRGQVPVRCFNCKTPDMIDVVHKPCKGADGTCIQRGNPKYRGYCTHCFSNMFPKDPLTFQIRKKSKENTVRDFINETFDGFQHDQVMSTGHCDCTVRRRIDHRKIIGNTILAIETDENQHKSYDAMGEETRYDDLYMAFSGKWVYIRFNPDSYIQKSGKKANPQISTRLKVLSEEINRQIARIERGENTDMVERVYLFYDGFN